jgi:hypothetical protein
MAKRNDGSAKLRSKKQEAFARKVALEGCGISEAYRASRDCKGMKATTVNANAKREMKATPVRLRIEWLQENGDPDAPVVSAAAAELTPKQYAFCRFYVEKSNASEAYRLAYDVSPATKPETVHRKAAEVLANGKVAARIAELFVALQKRHEGIVDRLSAEYEKLAFFDISQAIQWGETVVVRDPGSGEIVSEAQSVQIRASKDMPPDIKAAISSIEQTKDGCLKVRFHDKTGALDSLARMHNLFKNVHEHTGKGGGPIQHQRIESLSDDELDDLIRREKEALAVVQSGQANGVARH